MKFLLFVGHLQQSFFERQLSSLIFYVIPKISFDFKTCTNEPSTPTIPTSLPGSREMRDAFNNVSQISPLVAVTNSTYSTYSSRPITTYITTLFLGDWIFRNSKLSVRPFRFLLSTSLVIHSLTKSKKQTTKSSW
jgi:hypothetical protein